MQGYVCIWIKDEFWFFVFDCENVDMFEVVLEWMCLLIGYVKEWIDIVMYMLDGWDVSGMSMWFVIVVIFVVLL